jgi:perosamine synthetase
MGGTMNRNIDSISVAPNASVLQALRVIDSGSIGICIIVNSQGRFISLLSDGDIRRGLLNGLTLDSSINAISHPATVVGRKGMREEEISSLLSSKIRVLPILDEDDQCIDLRFLNYSPFIPVSSPQLDQTELRYVSDCILSGWISSTGPYVKEFEKRFAQYTNTRFAATSSNGTTALHLLLAAMEIGPGDEVIVPTMTFIATANAVRYTGAKPVFADCTPDTWCIDPEDVKRKMTERTKAVIPVHLFGHPCDMDALANVVRGTDVKLIEDAAEAHGARYKNRMVGSLGYAAIFSFFGNKIITTGEGGMVVTNDEALDAKLRLLRDHGMDPKNRFHHIVLGFNYRMTNLQAAVGCAQMEKIEKIVQYKRQIAQWYQQELANLSGISYHREHESVMHVYWLFGILIDTGITGYQAEELRKHLLENNVDSRPFFPPVHSQVIYNEDISMPVSGKLYHDGICLPSNMGITRSDVIRICKLIKSFRK